MSLTIGLTGMDPATESSLKAAFAEANQRSGGHWQLLPEPQADFVVVDMDSMYGPMSWLRLHAAGKTVIGLTSAPRTQTDFRLAHPFDGNSVAELLQAIIEQTGQTPVEGHPGGMTPAPQPQDALPEEQPQPRNEETAPPPVPAASEPGPGKEPPSVAVAETVPASPSIEPAAAAPAPEPRTLVEWLAAGRLQGRVRVTRDGQALLIDPAARQYHGPATLKPLAAHVSEDVGDGDFQQLDDTAWTAESTTLGAAQPLSRLVWYSALIRGQGQIAAGFDPDGRYQMLKWPQTEREYPKHFRIATVMMKGPATLAEIAEASGVPLADVTDFVNANLATGYADVEHAPDPEPEAPQKSGLFGRFRR